jgi:hypothetical protein
MKYYEEENKEMLTLGKMGFSIDSYYEAKKAEFGWNLDDYPLIGEKTGEEYYEGEYGPIETEVMEEISEWIDS